MDVLKISPVIYYQELVVNAHGAPYTVSNNMWHVLFAAQHHPRLSCQLEAGHVQPGLASGFHLTLRGILRGAMVQQPPTQQVPRQSAALYAGSDLLGVWPCWPCSQHAAAELFSKQFAIEPCKFRTQLRYDSFNCS